MAKIYSSAESLIGNTPLLELVNLQKSLNLNARIFAKLEFFNPAGSVKDRVAKAMLDEYENSGLIGAGSVIIEPTSGNTGIGLAAAGAARGYRIIIVMPDTMSAERIKLINAYGAEAVLSDGKKGMSGAIEAAERLHSQIKDSIIAGQFVNPANPRVHYLTTGPEIWNDTGGELDIFVAGVGTGGTISGAGRFLKDKNPQIKVVAVEPAGSAVLSGKGGGAHGLQGIGAGFVPQTLDTSVYDEIVCVTEKEAYACARTVGRREGLLIGISSGAALSAAIKTAQKAENKGKNIVVIFPDGGDRYLSTDLY